MRPALVREQTPGSPYIYPQRAPPRLVEGLIRCLDFHCFPWCWIRCPTAWSSGNPLERSTTCAATRPAQRIPMPAPAGLPVPLRPDQCFTSTSGAAEKTHIAPYIYQRDVVPTGAKAIAGSLHFSQQDGSQGCAKQQQQQKCQRKPGEQECSLHRQARTAQ